MKNVQRNWVHFDRGMIMWPGHLLPTDKSISTELQHYIASILFNTNWRRTISAVSNAIQGIFNE